MTLDDIFADILSVGDATGAQPAAERFVTELRGRVAHIQKRTALLTSADRPRIAAIEWIEPVMLAGNWMPRLIELAGGVQPLAQEGQHSTYGESRDVIAFDPQIVLVMPCGFDLARAITEAEVLSKVPGWNDLSAVRAGRVYAVDGNAYFNRSGPRIVDSLEILAGLLHPKIFGWPPRVAGGVPIWQQLT